jgi:hypothetical protein
MAPIESSVVTVLPLQDITVLEAYWLVEVQRLDLHQLVEVDLYQLVVVQQRLVGLEVYLLEVYLLEVYLLEVYLLEATQSTMACMLLRCSVKLVMLLAANRNRANPHMEH